MSDESPVVETSEEPTSDFSYDPAQLATNKLYQVRFRIGDTEESTAHFKDAEIQFALDSSGENVLEACISCVTAILPRVASGGEGFKVGPYQENGPSAGSLAYWTRLLEDLKAERSMYSSPKMAPTGPSIFHYGMMGQHDHSAVDPY